MTDRSASADSASRWTFRPATADRWDDLAALFGDRGACGNCWCMFWRRTRKEWTQGKTGGNRRALRRLVARGVEPGVLAYAESTPVGWCAIAPRSEYSSLARSRVLAPLDELAVWSISCLFVRREERRQGLSSALIAAAARHAFEQGAPCVEAYPVEPRKGSEPPPFLWTGTLSAYLRAGFSEVARRSPTRPIVRRAAPATPIRQIQKDMDRRSGRSQ